MTAWLAVLLAFSAAAAAGAVVGGLGWVVARRSRRLGWAVLVPPVTALAAVVASVAVSTRAMYLDAPQTGVVMAACAGGAAAGLLAAVLLAGRVRRLEDDVAARRAEALAEQSSERARREVLAALTHDLRSPLAAIRAMAEALEDGVAVAEDGYLTRIKEEADRTAAMVEEMFFLARLQAGLEPRGTVDVDAVAAVHQAVSRAGPLARRAEVELVADAPPPARPLLVRAAPGALDRVLSNLVHNAVRETGSHGTGRAQVVVALAEEDEDVLLRVRDSCGGIAPEDVPHLFEPGWRRDGARTPEGDRAGAGLGLTVVRELLERAGGSVALESAPGGCCFAVRLPRVVAG